MISEGPVRIFLRYRVATVAIISDERCGQTKQKFSTTQETVLVNKDLSTSQKKGGRHGPPGRYETTKLTRQVCTQYTPTQRSSEVYSIGATPTQVGGEGT